MPEITVAITTHNLETYLCQCIKELLTQTFQNFEIVIYDDYSTDDTRNLLAEYQASNPERLHIILGSSSLGSPAKARNAILESGAITGKYLLFLDGDDNIEPDFLEKLYQSAEEHHSDIAICAYDRFAEDSGHILCREMQGFPPKLILPSRDDILPFINGSLWNKLIRMSRIGTLQIPDFKVGEDISFFMALLERCQTLSFVDDILIHYRVRAASVISNTQEETIYQFAEELLRLRNASSHDWMKDVLSLVAFIHIGISMPIRIYRDSIINQKRVLSWISQYFSTNFNWFRGVEWFTLPSLLRHGIKGAGLWGAKLCYRLHCFSMFLYLYQWMTKIFHIDIKF